MDQVRKELFRAVTLFEDAPCYKTEELVRLEIHTFSGVPHGQAGVRIFGENPYPTFELWLPLADKFMQDIFA